MNNMNFKPYKDKVRKDHYSNNVQKIRTSQLCFTWTH